MGYCFESFHLKLFNKFITTIRLKGEAFQIAHQNLLSHEEYDTRGIVVEFFMSRIILEVSILIRARIFL